MEIINKGFDVELTTSRINPVLFNANIFLNEGIARPEEVDSSNMRISPISTNLEFNNSSADQILIRPTALKIKSFDIDQIGKIVRIIGSEDETMTFNACVYKSDLHIERADFPSAYFDPMFDPSVAKIDFLRLNLGHNNVILVYPCTNNSVHLKLESRLNLYKNVPLKDCDINAIIDTEAREEELKSVVSKISAK